MTNPFDDIDNAMTPMFCDVLSASCTRDGETLSSQINCCIFPIENENPFEDTTAHSEIKKMCVLVMYKDWNNSVLSSINPEIGDKVILDDGTNWNVGQAEREFGRWNITIRNKV